VAVVVAGLAAAALASTRAERRAADRPALALRATPSVGFAPAEILFVGELKGGADDYREFYCTSVEWDWDDDTRSEETYDCEPYEAGKSEIRRRFSKRHEFQLAGAYEVRLHLKNKNDIVTSARTRVEIRGGAEF